MSGIHTALDSEKAALGACISGDGSFEIARGLLRPDDFTRPMHRYLWDVLERMADAGTDIDPITVLETIVERRDSEEGTTSYAQALTQSCATTSHIASYCAPVARCAALRRAAALSEQIGALAAQPEASLMGIRELAESILEETSKKGATSSVSTLPESVDIAYARAMDIHANPGRLRGLSTGLLDLDKKLGGLIDQNLIIVAARTSHGKSVLGVQITHYVSRQPGIGPVLLFTLETPTIEVSDRLLSSEAGINSETIRDGKMTFQEVDRLTAARDALQFNTLITDDTPHISLRDMKATIKRVEAKRGPLSLICVDYLQNVEVNITNDVQKVTAIAEGLKQLAREHKCPLLATAQLSRSVEQRENKRPLLSDLRQSGGIEQAADVVIMIYREAEYEKQETGPVDNATELIIAKHRNGATGTVKVGWQPELARFVNLEFHSVGYDQHRHWNERD